MCLHALKPFVRGPSTMRVGRCLMGASDEVIVSRTTMSSPPAFRCLSQSKTTLSLTFMWLIPSWSPQLHRNQTKWLDGRKGQRNFAFQDFQWHTQRTASLVVGLCKGYGAPFFIFIFPTFVKMKFSFTSPPNKKGKCTWKTEIQRKSHS